MVDPIKVLIVDDHDVVRTGLTTYLSLHDDLSLVGTASDGVEALDLVASERPDVVVMDLKMPAMDGATATARIRAEYPDVQVVALTSVDDREMIRAVMQAGAIGFLFKDADEQELVNAIRMAGRGQSVVAHEAMQAMMHLDTVTDVVSLTDREEEILRLVARGRTNPDIAERLGISVSTVNFHVHNILDKLDARTRTEAVSNALRDGILEL